jgi:hypothetical protein
VRQNQVMADLTAAKRRVLEAIGSKPWCSGVGVGLVGERREKGLIVSLGDGAPKDAGERIRALVPEVPVQVRGLREVRKLGL